MHFVDFKDFFDSVCADGISLNTKRLDILDLCMNRSKSSSNWVIKCLQVTVFALKGKGRFRSLEDWQKQTLNPVFVNNSLLFTAALILFLTWFTSTLPKRLHALHRRAKCLCTRAYAPNLCWSWSWASVFFFFFFCQIRNNTITFELIIWVLTPQIQSFHKKLQYQICCWLVGSHADVKS